MLIKAPCSGVQVRRDRRAAATVVLEPNYSPAKSGMGGVKDITIRCMKRTVSVVPQIRETMHKLR